MIDAGTAPYGYAAADAEKIIVSVDENGTASINPVFFGYQKIKTTVAFSEIEMEDNVLSVKWSCEPEADHYSFAARYLDEENQVAYETNLQAKEIHISLPDHSGYLQIWVGAFDQKGNLTGQTRTVLRSHKNSTDNDNANVPVQETCPVYEDGHLWHHEWSEEHPHYGRSVCECGAVMEDQNGETRSMPDCCECGNHDWMLSYYVNEGKGTVLGSCRRCNKGMDVTDSMPDYIRNYVQLLAESGTEGNAYFEAHDTGNITILDNTAPWVYIAIQALTRYTDKSTNLKEGFVDALAEPFVTVFQFANGEYSRTLEIESKTQLLWIQLIQEMLTENEQEVSAKPVKDLVTFLEFGTDYFIDAYDSLPEWPGAGSAETFKQSVNEFENVRNARNALVEEEPDSFLFEEKLGEELTTSIPYILNAISAVVEGSEVATKINKMRNAYIDMLNDYDRSRVILEKMKEDAAARNIKELEDAVDTIADILGATYLANLGEYFDVTTVILDSAGNVIEDGDLAGAETALISLFEKNGQTYLMSLLDDLAGKVSPLSIASTAAKILKAVTNYDEIFDASTELAALSSMHLSAALSQHKPGEQISPYTMALYAKLESEGYGKAADFVDLLSSDETDVDNINVDKIMQKIIEATTTTTTPTLDLAMMTIDEMNVGIEEFGIGSNEKETVVQMLRKEKRAYDSYVRQYLQDAGRE